MKDKLFLTGARGVGKSTCIDRVLGGIACPVGGFRTRFASDNRSLLLLSDVSDRDARIAAHFTGEGKIPVPETFNGYGVSLLSSIPAPGLLLMDELGFLERDALAFRCAVLDALDADTPVLGVIRQGALGWLDALRRHERVEVVTVTEENRDTLPGEIRKRLAAMGVR